MRRPFVGGNWKMNTDQAGAAELTRSVVEGIAGDGCEVAIFPPFPYLLTVGSILRERSSTLMLGAQDAYHQGNGAFTGEVSLDMLKDCGVSAVLIGHSERRHVIGETDDLIALKTRAIIEAEMHAVLCIGETLEQREAGETDAVNERQLKAALSEINAEQTNHLTVAYEPVWAIGTGKTATPADAQDAHAKVRAVLVGLFGDDAAASIRIQYGGSVKPANAAELFAQPDIDGGLIGGASLKAADFAAIVKATG
ncbi:MAG: triose-phosphate isomerase [Planctomycetota bacterium]